MLVDDTQLYDVHTVSNVRQDLSEWQARHANLVLQTVKVASFLLYKEISRNWIQRGIGIDNLKDRLSFVLMYSSCSGQFFLDKGQNFSFYQRKGIFLSGENPNSEFQKKYKFQEMREGDMTVVRMLFCAIYEPTTIMTNPFENYIVVCFFDILFCVDSAIQSSWSSLKKLL